MQAIINKQVLAMLTEANELLNKGHIDKAETLLKDAEQQFEASNNTRYAPQANKIEALHNLIQKRKKALL